MKKDDYKVLVTLYMDNSLREKLRVQAKKMDLTVNKYICYALDKHFNSGRKNGES